MPLANISTMKSIVLKWIIRGVVGSLILLYILSLGANIYESFGPDTRFSNDLICASGHGEYSCTLTLLLNFLIFDPLMGVLFLVIFSVGLPIIPPAFVIFLIGFLWERRRLSKAVKM